MKHLTIYEQLDYTIGQTPYDNRKYINFIYDKFRLGKMPYGNVEYVETTDIGVRFYIKMGGDIRPEFLKKMIEFFEKCRGHISIPHSGDVMYYDLMIPYNFLKELDIEIDSKLYNI